MQQEDEINYVCLMTLHQALNIKDNGIGRA
jgi:hypothetical protein